VVTKSTDSKEDKGEFLQIYEKGLLSKTFDLKEIGKHNGIYSTDGKN
jgi:hypothetical protein